MYYWFAGLPFPGVFGIIDIVIVAFVLYWVMLLVKGTRAEKMLLGLAAIVMVYFVSGRFELLTLHWILNNFLGSLVIIIIVVFQQDIRRALVQMGRAVTAQRSIPAEFLEEISGAVVSMSEKKMGGLIVIERVVELRDFLTTFIDMDAEISKELFLTVFNPASPLHDGAVVVRKGRVSKAGCILPLTEKELPKSMGTRHRAAVGLSEETDAVIIVVSEETGEITLVNDEKVEQAVKPGEFLSRLKEIMAEGTSPSLFSLLGRS